MKSTLIKKNWYSTNLLKLLVALIFISINVKADQPVNCLRKHVHEQVWLFHVSTD